MMKEFAIVVLAMAACTSTNDEVLPGDPAGGTVTEAASNGDCNPTCSGMECGGSPIVVDVAGNGWQLTDGAHGVRFDLRGNGSPEIWSWTALGSDDAWLALDRNGDGAITDGTELFGDYTPQPATDHRNGFNALQPYDENHDGKIDAHDPVYASLRLWRDTNHDGVSQASELHTLVEFGVKAISLNYSLSARVDQYGNVYRYRSTITPAPGSHVNPVTYDVFLSTSAGQAVASLVGSSYVDGNGVEHEAQTACGAAVCYSANSGYRISICGAMHQDPPHCAWCGASPGQCTHRCNGGNVCCWTPTDQPNVNFCTNGLISSDECNDR